MPTSGNTTYPYWGRGRGKGKDTLGKCLMKLCNTIDRTRYPTWRTLKCQRHQHQSMMSLAISHYLEIQLQPKYLSFELSKVRINKIDDMTIQTASEEITKIENRHCGVSPNYKWSFKCSTGTAAKMTTNTIAALAEQVLNRTSQIIISSGLIRADWTTKNKITSLVNINLQLVFIVTHTSIRVQVFVLVFLTEVRRKDGEPYPPNCCTIWCVVSTITWRSMLKDQRWFFLGKQWALCLISTDLGCWNETFDKEWILCQNQTSRCHHRGKQKPFVAKRNIQHEQCSRTKSCCVLLCQQAFGLRARDEHRHSQSVYGVYWSRSKKISTLNSDRDRPPAKSMCMTVTWASLTA